MTDIPKTKTRYHIKGYHLTMHRCVNDAVKRGDTLMQSRCGFAATTYTNGWFEETKRMVDVAYEVWRKKRKIPRFDHFGCIGIRF